MRQTVEVMADSEMMSRENRDENLELDMNSPGLGFFPNKKLIPFIENQFKPGHSGNPSGRPRSEKHIVALARECSEEAINTLREIMNDPEQRGAARVAAANSILDRAFGKAPMRVKLDDPSGEQNRLGEMVRKAVNGAAEVVNGVEVLPPEREPSVEEALAAGIAIGVEMED